MSKQILSAFLGFGLIGCSSVQGQLSDIVFMPNSASDQRAEDEISLEIAFSANAPAAKIDPDVAEEMVVEAYSLSGFSGVSASAKMAEIAISQIGKTLTQEAQRYTASYSSEASSDAFYFFDNPSGYSQIDEATRIRATSEIQFAGFKFTRWIKQGSKDERKRAMTICAIALPNTTDQFFQIIPISYQMTYSKAKLIGFNMLSPFGVDILNPWEIITDPLTGKGYDKIPSDTDLDLTMAVSFEYLHYTGENDELVTTAVSPNTFDVKGLKVTGKPYQGRFSAFNKFVADMNKEDDTGAGGYEFECNDETTPEQIADYRDKIMGLPLDNFPRMRLGSGAKIFPSSPRVMGDFGNGNFMIKVEVTEFDDYGKRIGEVSKAFDQNKSSLQQKLTDSLN
ncbi:MAG: hypothetical protein V3V30_10200 [Parvularculaceae bacterium]